MANARLNRLRVLENRVAETLAIDYHGCSGPQESPYGTYCLTSTQQEAMLKQARVKMRRARLVQVRAQEMLLASQRIEQVRCQRRQAKKLLLREVKLKWEAGQRHRLEELQEELSAALDGVGQAHRAASRLQQLKEVKEVTTALQIEERRCCAALRYAEALEKEHSKRDELESKKGLALERRKQVEDTAEMDRNLARVSAYGAKIKSKLRQIKQTIQPECKPDYDVAKLRDYKYTFMHNHWAALRDKTNAKEDDANAWEAADRKRADHDQMRSRDGEVAKIAKQRVAQRAQAAHCHFAKEQEIRRLERELKNVQKQETERKIAAMLSGEPYHAEDLSTGAEAPGLQKAVGSPRVVLGEEHRNDRHPHVELHNANSHESKPEPLQSDRPSPLQIQVKTDPEFSSDCATVHGPGDSAITDEAQAVPNAETGVSDGLGLHPSPRAARCQVSQAYRSKPLVKKSKSPFVSSRSAKNAGLETSPSPKARCRHSAVSCKPRSVVRKEKQAQDGEQSRRNGTGMDCPEPVQGGRKRQAQVLSLAEGNSRQSSKLFCRKCWGCGQESEDMKVGDPTRICPARVGSVKGSANSRRTATRERGGGALASAVSLLDKILGTAEVLEKFQEASPENLGRVKLPGSIKDRIRSTQQQLEALEQELFGQPRDLKGLRRMPKKQGNRDSEMSEAVQSSLQERRKKGLEKHMRRMDNRSMIDQVGENLWNIQKTREGPVNRILSGRSESEKPKRHAVEAAGQETELGNASSRGKGKGNQLKRAMRLQKQQVKEKSFFSMQLEDFEFLKDLQQSLQKLKHTSNGDECVSTPLDKVPQSYKTIMKRDRPSGQEKTSVLSSKVQRRHRKPSCGRIHGKSLHGSGRNSQELALPEESGGDIGPWDTDKDSVRANRSNMAKTKRRGAGVPGTSRTRQTSARMKRSRKINEQRCGRSRRAVTAEKDQNLDPQDCFIFKAGTESLRSRKIQHSLPDPPVREFQRQGMLTLSAESSHLESLAQGDLIRPNSPTQVECMSSSDVITSIGTAGAASLMSGGQDLLLEKHAGDASTSHCDDRLKVETVATQVTSTDLDPFWSAQADDNCVQGLRPSSIAEDLNEILDEASTLTEGLGYTSAVPALGSSRLHGKPAVGSSWDKIWEEVCRSIDSELEGLASQAQSSGLNKSVDTVKRWEHRHRLQATHRRESLSRELDSELDSPVAGGELLESDVDVTAQTDGPSIDSVLGSLSQQVREWDERLRTATSSAVASSWAISENSRLSKQTTSWEGVPSIATDGTADGTHGQFVIKDMLPVSEVDSSLLSRPAQTLWRRTRTDDSFSGKETLNPTMWKDANIVRGIQRRTTVCLEGKGDSDGVSSETGSPVSPLGLCFDAIHDMQARNRGGADRGNLDGVAHSSHGVPHGEANSLLRCQAAKDVKQSERDGVRKLWAHRDVEASNAGSSVLVLPCRPRTRAANRGNAEDKFARQTAKDDSELPTEAGHSGRHGQAKCLFLTADETNADGRQCKAGEIVSTSLSSFGLLDMGESLLTASIDFSLWSSEVILDIFEHPDTSTSIVPF